jgi:glycosyltransferase involved in cell wall biosynthesis
MDTRKQSVFEFASSSSHNPKRVLQIVHRMRPGGVQALVMNVYRHIDRSRVQFDFAVRSQQPEHYDEEIKALGGRLFHLPWSRSNPFRLTHYKCALATLLGECGPFIAVHSHVGLFSGHILPIARQANIPLRLAHSHSAFIDKPSTLRNIWASFMRCSIRRNATHMLACSSLAAEWLYGTQGHQDTRVVKVPNAIDLGLYAGLGSDQSSWRKVVGLPEKGILIGHVGRFDHVKNHIFLLEIFSAFHRSCPDAKLVLVGEGVLKQQIEQQATAKGIKDAVIFMGVRNDVPQILGAVDVLMLPSLHEGFGIVLVEAQAAGTPCLVSDTVATEVDLGLGLVQFMSLDLDAHAWAQALKRPPPRQIPGWKERKAALQKAGYGIRSSVELLQRLYLATREI